MIKKGFTLAEVLITLGIIGVVAALTAPALVKNTGSAKIGPTLAKFANTYETGIESLMSDANVSKLSSLAEGNTAGTNIMAALANYVIMTPVDLKYEICAPQGTSCMTSDPAGDLTSLFDSARHDIFDRDNPGTYKDGEFITPNDGRNSDMFGKNLRTYLDNFFGAPAYADTPIDKFNKYLDDLRSSVSSVYLMKDGTYVWMQVVNGHKYDAKGSYKGYVGTIYLGIGNNTEKKNRAGKNAFAFLLDNTGTLIPYGSNAHKYVSGETYTCDKSGTTVASGLACTGAFADNNWKS